MLKDFQWNNMYIYLMQAWEKMDHTKSFKSQFCDNNVHITEYVNEYNEHLILAKYIINKDLYNNPNSIYREARSLVIDLNTQEIVLCPYKKFFNINEIPETDITIVIEQIKNADIVEFSDKLDGSMQSARWYNNHIILSGSSALDKQLSFQLKEGYDLFYDNYIQLCKDNPDITFIFEAILQDDKHIVNYHTNRLLLVGARDIYTGYTESYKNIIKLGNQYDIPTTIIESITLNTCLEKKSNYKATEKEGWVIYIRKNDNEYRYKLKCDDYIQLHKIINKITDIKYLINLIIENKVDDILSNISIEYKDILLNNLNKIYKFMEFKNKIINYYYQLIINNFINEYTDKEFAIFVQKNIPQDIQSYMYMKHKNKKITLLKANMTEEDMNKFIIKYKNSINA